MMSVVKAILISDRLLVSANQYRLIGTSTKSHIGASLQLRPWRYLCGHPLCTFSSYAEDMMVIDKEAQTDLRM